MLWLGFFLFFLLRSQVFRLKKGSKVFDWEKGENVLLESVAFRLSKIKLNVCCIFFCIFLLFFGGDEELNAVCLVPESHSSEKKKIAGQWWRVKRSRSSSSSDHHHNNSRTLLLRLDSCLPACPLLPLLLLSLFYNNIYSLCACDRTEPCKNTPLSLFSSLLRLWRSETSVVVVPGPVQPFAAAAAAVAAVTSTTLQLTETV